MNKVLRIGVVLGFALLLSLIILASIFSGWGYHGFGWGMMGPGMMWGFNPLGGFGMIFMSFTPVIVIVLVVLGITWLIRQSSSPKQ